MLLPHFIALLLLFAGSAAECAQVLLVTKNQKLVAISHEAGKEWAINDEICVYHDEREVACGRVVKVRTKAAIVRLDQREAEIVKGDTAKPRAEGSNEKLQNEFFVRSEFDPHEWFNLRNASLGVNWLSATFHLQQAIASNFAVGLQPVYLLQRPAGNGDLKGLGILLTMNFYERNIYNGFWAQAGGGWYFINGLLGGASEELRSIVLSLNAGWRWRFSSDVNIGLAAGAQYLLKTQFTSFDLGFGGFIPSVVLEIGYVF